MTVTVGSGKGRHAKAGPNAFASRGLAALLLSAIAIISPSTASGETFESGEEPVLLLADQVDVDEPRQIVTATGDVEITRGNRRLIADKVRYYQGEDRIEAIGNVTLLEPDGQAIYAELLAVSGDLKDGIIEGLRARLDQDSRLAARSAERFEGVRTEMNQAVYSPCPLWCLPSYMVPSSVFCRLYMRPNSPST